MSLERDQTKIVIFRKEVMPRRETYWERTKLEVIKIRARFYQLNVFDSGIVNNGVNIKFSFLN